MRQAIQTRFLGPTNSRGARVKAWCNAGALTLPWKYHLNDREQHQRVAAALALRLDWPGEWTGGGLPGGGYAFCHRDGGPRESLRYDLERCHYFYDGFTLDAAECD